MGFLRVRLQLAYFKWQLLAKTVLASVAILLLPAQTRMARNRNQFYRFLLPSANKKLCACPYKQGERKRVLPCSNFRIAALAKLESCPIYQKVAGLVPSQDTYLGCGFDPGLAHIVGK